MIRAQILPQATVHRGTLEEALLCLVLGSGFSTLLWVFLFRELGNGENRHKCEHREAPIEGVQLEQVALGINKAVFPSL